MTRPLPIALLGLAGGIVGGACTPAVFECSGPENCISRGVQGVCQPTGFCSYPDPDCESEQAYDEFAGDGLAQRCVDEDPCGPPPCIDADGDGWGIGDGCAGPDCDDDNPAHGDRCVYVSPGGDDAAAGTIDAPWGTIARALVDVQPGTSLVLLDGVYEASTTGLLSVACGEGGNAPNGTADAPIVVRAANERAAQLVGGGATPAIQLFGCGFWELHGLRATGGDLRGSEGGTQADTVYFTGLQNVLVRRLLVERNNRIFNTSLVGIQGSTDVLVEDAEVYEFHRSAFQIYGSERVTLRRCYANSRGHADLPDCNFEVDPEVPYCSSPGDAGDAAFGIWEDVTDVRFENCISEGRVGTGFEVGAGSDSVAIHGSIVMPDADYGMIVAARDLRPVTNTSIADSLVLAPLGAGVYMRSTTGTRLDGVTVLRSAEHGVYADQNSSPLCTELPGGCSFTADRVLALFGAASGIASYDQTSWLVSAANAFGNTDDYVADEAIDDEMGNIQRSYSMEAGIGTSVGQCVVYVPPESPVHGLGPGGADIGATILRRVEGELTDEPLWDPQTGAFPCGATVPGVNDEPSSSCIGVHTRLNVWSNGCMAPPDAAAPDCE